MAAWAQRAGVVLLAVTAWTAPGGGGTVTADRPPALAQTSAVASAREIPQPQADAASLLSDANVVAQREAQLGRRPAEAIAVGRQPCNAPRPGEVESAAAERDLATEGGFVAPPPQPREPGLRLAMEPGDDAPPSEAPAPDNAAPEPDAVGAGPQPRARRLQDTEV